MTDVIDNEVEQGEGRGRRELLGKAALAAAVAAVSGVAISQRASANAGNGANLQQGIGATGVTATTSIAGGSTFVVTNGLTSGPTGGTNARVGSIFGTNSISDRAGVMGETTSTSGGWAIYGRSAGDFGCGVYGLTSGSQGNGVFGEHAKTTSVGTGVAAKSINGPGLWSSGTTYDLEAVGSGKILLSAALGATALNLAATVGTIARDATGNLWYCSKTGTPGEWHTLTGPGGAGAFYALTPGRLYDSRSIAPVGPLAAGANRVVTLRDRFDAVTSVLSASNYVPAGATAITCNVTVVNTVAAGFLAVNPKGDTTVHAATINWSASGQILNNGVTITLGGDREVTVVAGGSAGAQTDFVIDVTGYFR